MNTNRFDKVYKMNTVFGIWRYSERIRVTYVSPTWLVVWDHKQSPPTRYDCHGKTHDEACSSVINKLQELTSS